MNSRLKTRKLQLSLTIILYIGYFFVNFLTLIRFPLVHSDEVWLGKLSSAYLANKSIYTTEPFFNLFPRQAHTLKSLFHLMQSLFIAVFGESIFSLRLLSLMAGICVLLTLHSIFHKKTKNHLVSLLIVMTLGLNVQFIYASHFGRQEIIMLLVLVICIALYSNQAYSPNLRYIIPGLIIGISIGFHPNAFILSAMFFALLLSDFIQKKATFKHLASYILLLATCAAVFVFTSLIGNPNFVQDYYTYGSTLSVDANPAGRLQNFMDFFIKLYQQISGTYYLPNLRFTLVLPLILFFILSILSILFKKDTFRHFIISKIGPWFLMLIAYATALFIIGRFNPTSILFYLLPSVMILSELLTWVMNKTDSKRLIAYALIGGLLLFNLSITYKAYQTYAHHTFSDYNEELSSTLTEESVILGNLSGGFSFSNNDFYDIRNLEYLDTATLESYLTTNKINTIIYYEEYDYIHRNPQWQILYGDDSAYYDALNDIIKTHGTLVHEFENAYYGTRIIRYIDGYPWSIQIYTIDLEND